MKLAVQLYNFRDELPKDFEGTLRKIADLGFDGVEFAGDYGNIPPADLAAMLNRCHLECAGGMFEDQYVLDDKNIAYEYAHQLKMPAITFSICCEMLSNYQTVLDKIIAGGKAAAANGVLFSYHNHMEEMAKKDGQTVLENFMDAVSPEQVLTELDVCWVAGGGEDPVRLIQKYSDRLLQIHLKDSRNPPCRNDITFLGDGVVNLTGCVAAAKASRCQWLIYEQDITQDPFGDAAKSLSWMRKAL